MLQGCPKVKMLEYREKLGTHSHLWDSSNGFSMSDLHVSGRSNLFETPVFDWCFVFADFSLLCSFIETVLPY